MNTLELTDKKNELRTQAQALVDAAKAEERELNEEERTMFDDLNKQIEEVNTEIRNIENEINNQKTTERKMEKVKKVGLFEALKGMVTNNVEDEVREAYNINGKKMEIRSAVTVGGTSGATVATEVADILPALRANNPLVKAGARFITGLTSDVKIPALSGAAAAWEGETDENTDGNPSISAKTLSPKRLSCYVDVSRQLIIQTNQDAEAILRDDLANAISEKLVQTALSANHGNDAPDGMFYNASVTSVDSFAKLVALESKIEDANMAGSAYVLSPKAKAALRGMETGAHGVKMVWENGEIDGTPAYVTSACQTVSGSGSQTTYTNNAVFGDWSNLVFGQFGNIEIIVDELTQARNGIVRLVVNAYFDFKVLRPSAFAFATISA